MKQITIVGVGLIGGSFALGLRASGWPGRIVGCDREEVLRRARERGAVDEGSADAGQAVRGSDLVLLATPVGAILDFLERIGPRLPAEVLVSDAGSTKAAIVGKADEVFGKEAARRFLGGHPMAGKEHGGIENAEAELFRGAPWLLVPGGAESGCGSLTLEGRAAELVALIERLGAKPAIMDAERHDRLCAWVSHLPQMLATALAFALGEELADDPDARAVGGRALREMTRIAASPYSMWRDIALTNSENIEQALLRLEQELAHLRENLKTGELKEAFEKAKKFVSP